MSDTPMFPLTPVELKHVVRLQRFREYVPPETDPQPFRNSNIFVHAAARVLKRHMRLHWDPVTAPNEERSPRTSSRSPVRQGISLHDQLPSQLVHPVALLIASSVLVLQLIYYRMSRADLHPRLIRKRLLTPLDIRKCALVSRTGIEFVRVSWRIFERRQKG
jgi:hypothetical protein